MTRAVYVAASEAESNKGTVALGLMELLSRQVETVGVFRPVVRAGREDNLVNTIRSRFQLAQPYEACAGVPYDQVHADTERATGDILARYFDVQGRPVESDLEDRIVGLSLEDVRQIPTVIAVAGGPSKVVPILGALRGRYVDVLITDETTAQQLLARRKSED